MGKIKYPHLPLLLESMKRNPTVDFKVINIVKVGLKQERDIVAIKNRLNVPNFSIHVITIEEFRNLLLEKFDMHFAVDESWYYKMCDFKPTLPFLFPKLVGEKYKYWGYADMDLIWGNITRFSHWFQGQYPFIHSGFNGDID